MMNRVKFQLYLKGYILFSNEIFVCCCLSKIGEEMNRNIVPPCLITLALYFFVNFEIFMSCVE